jgi:hypothetical protein
LALDERSAVWIDDFQLCRLLEDVDGLLGVVDAWKFDQNLVTATGLDQWFRHTERVDATLECVARTIECRLVDGPAIGGFRLHQDLEATLKVKTLPDRMVLAKVSDVETFPWQIHPDRGNREKGDNG